MPKIYSFNLSKEKAKFFKDNKENLKKLSKLYYDIKKERFSVLPEVIERLLSNGLDYSYLAKLIRLYLNKDKSEYYKVNFETYHLQTLNTIVSKFLNQIVFGGKTVGVEDRELWYIYRKGEELARRECPPKCVKIKPKGGWTHEKEI
ncbi:type I-B CRISPR-associated protein Cas8b1/Cst1 [Desulfurobacterium thermolithotrophum]|uniref:type I-B CRISPR-associated protein Cas8b1/Cst1 n=1 Tax=Desulfurobacterium thermolithotrophum TaxID=64160 RepID=UPI003984A23F